MLLLCLLESEPEDLQLACVSRLAADPADCSCMSHNLACFAVAIPATYRPLEEHAQVLHAICRQDMHAAAHANNSVISKLSYVQIYNVCRYGRNYVTSHDACCGWHRRVRSLVALCS